MRNLESIRFDAVPQPWLLVDRALRFGFKTLQIDASVNEAYSV